MARASGDTPHADRRHLWTRRAFVGALASAGGGGAVLVALGLRQPPRSPSQIVAQQTNLCTGANLIPEAVAVRLFVRGDAFGLGDDGRMEAGRSVADNKALLDAVGVLYPSDTRVIATSKYVLSIRRSRLSQEFSDEFEFADTARAASAIRDLRCVAATDPTAYHSTVSYLVQLGVFESLHGRPSEGSALFAEAEQDIVRWTRAGANTGELRFIELYLYLNWMRFDHTRGAQAIPAAEWYAATQGASYVDFADRVRRYRAGLMTGQVSGRVSFAEFQTMERERRLAPIPIPSDGPGNLAPTPTPGGRGEVALA